MITVRPIKISCDRLNNPMGKNSRILCTNELHKKLYSVFNADNMTALQHYAEKENAKIYFSYLPNDKYHNTEMFVLKNESQNSERTTLKISFDTKDNFANSLRNIYNCASESIKKLSQK